MNKRNQNKLETKNKIENIKKYKQRLGLEPK